METIIKGLLVTYLATVIHGFICCAPKKFEACQYGRRSEFRPNLFEDEIISYDVESKKKAISGETEKDGVTTRFKIIDDYSKSTRYVIEPKSRKCTTYTQLGTVFPEYCVPDNAADGGRTYVGAGEKKLNVTAYKFSVKKDLYDIELSVVITDECIPLYSDATGTFNNTPYIENVHFVKFTTSISNTSVFNPPDYCDEAIRDLTDDNSLRENSILKFF